MFVSAFVFKCVAGTEFKLGCQVLVHTRESHFLSNGN